MLILIYDLNKISNWFYLVIILNNLPIEFNCYFHSLATYHFFGSSRRGLSSGEGTYMPMFFMSVDIRVCTFGHVYLFVLMCILGSQHTR